MTRSLGILICVCSFALCIGCRSTPDSRFQPGVGGVITTEDRNGDGRVDRELHTFPGAGDMDWELRDNDFDGVYEELIRYGVGVKHEKVHLPVPPTAKNAEQKH